MTTAAMAAIDYAVKPTNWTICYLEAAMRRTSNDLAPALDEARQILRSNPALHNLRAKSSKALLATQGQLLRQNHSHLFTNIPQGTLIDREIGSGIIRTVLPNIVKHERSETPAPIPMTPTSSSSTYNPSATPVPFASPRSQPVAANDLILYISLGPYSVQNSPLEATLEGILYQMGVSFLQGQDLIQLLTRQAFVDLLVDQHYMTSPSDQLFGIRGLDNYTSLSNDFLLREFLRVRSREGSARVHFYTVTAGTNPPSSAHEGSHSLPQGSVPNSLLGVLDPRLQTAAEVRHANSSPGSARKHRRMASDVAPAIQPHIPQESPTKRPRTDRLSSPSDKLALPSSRRGTPGPEEVEHRIEDPDPDFGTRSNLSEDEEVDSSIPGIIDDEFEENLEASKVSWQKTLDQTLNSPAVEHMMDPRVWHICCRLINILPTDLTTEADIWIPGIRFPVNQYQFFAAVLFCLWAREKNGGYLSDGMGVGKTLEGLLIIMLEVLFRYNFDEVARCRASSNAAERSKHIDVNGKGKCAGAPRFFSQCYCDASSDLSKYFQPRRGCALIFAAKPIVPVWKAAWTKFYQPKDNLNVKFLVLHAQHGTGKWAANADDLKNLRCIYPKECLPDSSARLFGQVSDSNWLGRGTATKQSGQYILITTPQSYDGQLLSKVSYSYRWSAMPDPPASGPGSRSYPTFTTSRVPALMPAWVLVDEFHMLKSLSRNAGPWPSIQDMHKCGPTIPSLVAISGTPISTGPLDIMGPLTCFVDKYDSEQPKAPQKGEAGYNTFLNAEILKEIGSTFAELLAANPKGEKMDQLIADFARRYQPMTLRRTEASQWGLKTIIELPPCNHFIHDVAFPQHYRAQLDQLQNITASVAASADGSNKQKASAYAKTTARQQLLISTIPWLAGFWTRSESNREERFLAADYAKTFLYSDGSWLSTHPLAEYTNRYDKDRMLPKFDVLDQVLRNVKRRDQKLLVFSQFIVLASFAQHYIANHPRYTMETRLWHAGLSADKKDDLQESFQDVKAGDGGVQVLCGVQSAMGTGVDLFAANHVVFLEPYGQPTQMWQAIKRAHRRGAKYDRCSVYKITCADDVDGVWAERLLLKKADARELFANGIFEDTRIDGVELDNDDGAQEED